MSGQELWFRAPAVPAQLRGEASEGAREAPTDC